MDVLVGLIKKRLCTVARFLMFVTTLWTLSVEFCCGCFLVAKNNNLITSETNSGLTHKIILLMWFLLSLHISFECKHKIWMLFHFSKKDENNIFRISNYYMSNVLKLLAKIIYCNFTIRLPILQIKLVVINCTDV